MAALQQHIAVCSTAQARMLAADGACSSAEELLEAGYAPAGPQRAEAAELAPGRVSLAWGRRSGAGGMSAPAAVEDAGMTGTGLEEDVGMGTIEDQDGSEEQAGVIERKRREASAERAQQQQEEQLDLLRRRAHAEAARRDHHCMVCGKTFQLTPTEILQHRRSHAAG